MNSLNLVDRLTRDPELRSLPDGRSVCDMRVSVNGAADGAPL
jgi:single-stranded DNA-binding protein